MKKMVKKILLLKNKDCHLFCFSPIIKSIQHLSFLLDRF